MEYNSMTFHLFSSVTHAIIDHATHTSPATMKPTNSGWDYRRLSITVSQSSGGESLMQSSISLIDSSRPSHQSLRRHYLYHHGLISHLVTMAH